MGRTNARRTRSSRRGTGSTPAKSEARRDDLLVPRPLRNLLVRVASDCEQLLGFAQAVAANPLPPSAASVWAEVEAGRCTAEAEEVLGFETEEAVERRLQELAQRVIADVSRLNKALRPAVLRRIELANVARGRSAVAAGKGAYTTASRAVAETAARVVLLTPGRVVPPLLREAPWNDGAGGNVKHRCTRFLEALETHFAVTRETFAHLDAQLRLELLSAPRWRTGDSAPVQDTSASPQAEASVHGPPGATNAQPGIKSERAAANLPPANPPLPDEKAVRVLKVLASQGHSLLVEDLAKLADCSVTTCRRRLDHLCALGFAQRLSPRGGVCITSAGSAYLADLRRRRSQGGS